MVYRGDAGFDKTGLGKRVVAFLSASLFFFIVSFIVSFIVFFIAFFFDRFVQIHETMKGD